MDNTLDLMVRGTNLTNQSFQQHVFGDIIGRRVVVELAYGWLYYMGSAIASVLRHNIWREFRRHKGEDPGEVAADEGLLGDVRSTQPPPDENITPVERPARERERD